MKPNVPDLWRRTMSAIGAAILASARGFPPQVREAAVSKALGERKKLDRALYASIRAAKRRAARRPKAWKPPRLSLVRSVDDIGRRP